MSIASLVLHSRPEDAERLRIAATALEGVEVHAVSDDGKLVVTVDRPADGETGAVIQSLNDLDGVLSASLIYAHFDDISDAEEHSP